jgi:hypothetical protein
VRNLNQDPLENLFGGIRSHGVRNVNPTATAFQAALKTMVINNFVSVHSPGANCEDDGGIGLTTLREYVMKGNYFSEEHNYSNPRKSR